MSQTPPDILTKLKRIRLKSEDKLKMRSEITKLIKKNPVIKSK